jgi:hypothetical protein
MNKNKEQMKFICSLFIKMNYSQKEFRIYRSLIIRFSIGKRISLE